MADNLVIESPDFGDIEDESGRATADAMKLLWYSLNNEILLRRKIARIDWEDVPFADLTFTASAGTWTVGSDDVLSFKMGTWNDIVILEWQLVTTTTSVGMTNELYINVPRGLTAQNGWTGWGFAAGAADEAVRVTTNSTNITLQRIDGSNWPTSSDGLYIFGGILFRVS